MIVRNVTLPVRTGAPESWLRAYPITLSKEINLNLNKNSLHGVMDILNLEYLYIEKRRYWLCSHNVQE